MRLWRSVRDLAEEVDDALGRLALAKGQEAAAQEALDLAKKDVAEAEQEVARARDALFSEHPELARDAAPTPPPADTEVVEVDDENDPRFTSGIVVSPDEDLPPIEWNEHDG